MEKNKFFTHRFLPILSVFLFVAFVFTSSVFASSDLSANNGNIYTLPDFTDEMKQYPNYLIFVENNGALFNLVFLVDDNGYFYNDSTGIHSYGRLLLCSSTGDNYYNSRYEVSSGTIAKIGQPITSSSVFISSVDIYKDVNKNEIFFQKPPIPALVEIMKQEKAEMKTIQEILGILPLILVVVVSFLGLRKALSWLLTLLRHC